MLTVDKPTPGRLEEAARLADREHDDVPPALDWMPADGVPGAYRVGHSSRPHLADGMTAHVCIGGGAYSTILNPQAAHQQTLGWSLTWADPRPYALTARSVIATFDYLLSQEITATEAVRRLRLLRNARAALARAGSSS